MPIEKRKEYRLRKPSAPFEMLRRDVIQSLTDPTALAIYAYLMSLPEDWSVCRQHILDHFDGLGRDRYDKAMATLKAAGLVWVVRKRDAEGRLAGSQVYVGYEPMVGNPAAGDDRVAGFPERSDFPAGRENPPLTEEDISTEEDKPHTQESRAIAARPALAKSRAPHAYLTFAGFMWSRIQRVTGATKEPNLVAWADDIRKLVELDGRQAREVGDVFRWANGHEFWSANILSAAKLREKFPQLVAQMRRDAPPADFSQIAREAEVMR